MDWASSEWMQELSPAALQKVQGLQEQMERFQKERQQKILKIDNLEQSINNQKLKLEEEKSENASLRRELQKLEEQCKDCENKQLKLQNEVQIRDAKISFLENQLDQMKMNLSMVHQFEADIANHKTELEKAERRNAETEAALKSQEEANYALQEQVAAFKSQLEAFSTTPDLMSFDCEKPEQEISSLQQKIADHEKTIAELKLKISEEDVETEISKQDSLASSLLSDSQNDPFWNKFESQSSEDLRRTVRVKSDSVLSTPQKHADEKVILLEQRLQQVTREFDCLRSNCEVIKAQMEQKFKDNEKELNAEIKHQSQIMVDLESQLQETKMKLQHDINHTNKELDTTKLQLDKVEKLKFELEENINQLSAQVQELNAVLQSKEKIIVELMSTKDTLEEEKAKLISKNEQLVFENDYLNLEIKKRDTVDDENEPELEQAESSNCKLASESTDNKEEFNENGESSGESLCEKVQLLELEVANANAVIESKNKEIGLMQEGQPKIVQEIEEKVMLIDELQERCDDLENQQMLLKEEINSLQDELSQSYVIISDKTLALDTVKIELSAVTNENEEKTLSNTELQEHNVTLCNENSSLQLEVEQKVADLAVIEKELLSTKEAFEGMQLVKNNLEMDLKKLQLEKDVVEEKIRLLEGEFEHAVADSKVKADDLDATKKELLELQNCVEQQTLTCTKLKESESGLTAQLETMMEQISKFEAVRHASESDLEAKSENIISLEQEIAAMKDAATEQLQTRTKLKESESELTAQLETMTEQISKFEAVRHASESDLKAKSKNIISLEQEIAAMKDAATEQLQILNELEAENKNHMQQEKSLEEKVTHLQQEIQQSVIDGENKTQALELANKELLGLKTDFNEKTLLHEELCLQRDKLMTENLNLTEEMEKRAQTLDCLQNEHSLLKASMEQESAKKQLEDSVTELNSELETARGKHKEFEELIQSLELHLDENSTTISVLNEEILMAKISAEQQQMMLNELQIGNKELCEQNTAFDSEIELLKQEINLKNNELEVNVKEFLNLKSEYEEKIRVNEILMQSDAERDGELKAKLETLIHLEEQARSLQSNLIEKDDQISALVEETSTLKETLEQQRAVISDLQTCYKTLEDQKQSLEEKIVNFGGELSNLKTELDEKAEVNVQLQTQNGNLSDQNKNLQSEVEQNYSTISSFENEIAMIKASFQEEIDKQLKEAAEANLQLKNSQEKLIEFENNVNLLSLEITEKNSVIVSLENKVSLLNLSLEEQVALVSALQTNSQEYEEQKKLLTSKLKTLEQELLEVGLDIQSRKGDFDSVKQEISELEQRYEEKKLQMRRLIESLIEVDERLKPVTGLLEVVERKMKTLESELEERETTILTLRDEIEVLSLSSEESERAKHTQEAEALRYKMDYECLEGELQELKRKSEFEREQAIELKVNLLKKNPTYSEQFSKCDADDVRNIAAISLNDDILNYYDSLMEEIQELKVCLEHLQKVEVQTEEQQVVINNLEKELQLSEDAVNLKIIDLQEITNSFHVQTATLTSTEEKLKLVEEELVSVKETSKQFENGLSEARVEFQSYHRLVEDVCSDMQTTKECLVEQHAISVDLREQLQREQLVVNKLIRDLIEIKFSASECLQSLGLNVFEPNSERDLADYVKSLMQELQSAVVKIIEEQNENEQSISGKEETSNALVKILHKYDSILLGKGTVTKQLQDKLNIEKAVVTNLTQALHEQSTFSENQENITFQLRNDLETCVLTIKTMMQKMKRLKRHFKKNVRYSRKMANIAQRFRTQLPVLKKREMNLRRTLKSEKCNVFKTSTFFANLLKMFVEKLNGSSTWPMEHLLFYAFSCFPEVFTQNAVQNFMNELQQTTSINPQSPTATGHLSLVPSDQVSSGSIEKGVFVNPKVVIIENTYYLSSEIEKLVTVLKEHDDLKKEAAHWKMQCEIYLPELCARKKAISDLQNVNSEFMMMIENLNSELDNATKSKQAMEKLVQDLITAASDAKGETEDLEERLEQLQYEQQEKIEDFMKTIIVKEQACFEMNKLIKELEQNLQETNNKNKELHEEVQTVTGGLKDLQKVIAENMETYYSPAQYEALETRAKSFHQEAESLKEKNEEVSTLIERIEAAILGILDEFPCDEVNYESNTDIPIILQKLQKKFEKQRKEFIEKETVLDLRNKEIMSFEVSVNELMSKMDTETVMLVEKTRENEKLQVCLTEAENQLLCYCEEIKQKENEISDLRENYNALGHSIVELQNQLTSLESANTSLNSTIAEVEENLRMASLEKQQLKEAFDTILVGHIHDYESISLDDIPTAVEKLCGELAQQKIELEAKKDTVNWKTEEAMILESSVSSLRERVNMDTEVLAEKDQEIQQLQIKLEESTNQLQSNSEDLKDKEQQLANWKIELDIKSASLEHLKKQAVSLESHNLVLNSTIDALKETMRQDELEQQQLKQQLDAILVEYVPSYESICPSLEQLPLAVLRLRNEYMREQVKVGCLKIDHDMKNDKITACERTIAELLFKVSTDEGLLAEKVQRIEQFELKLKESEDQLQHYKQEAKDKECEINDWKEKYGTSNKSLDELQNHLTSLESENSLLKLTVEELEANLQKSCLTKQQLKSDLDKILMEYMSNYEDASFDAIPTTIQKLCDEFTQKQSETDELKLAVDMQTKDLTTLETSIKKLKDEFDTQANLLVEKTQEINQLKSKLEEYEIQVRNCNQSFQGKESEISDWKMKCDDSKKLVDELQTEVSDLELINTRLNAAIAEVEDDLQKMTLERKQLKDSIEKILTECIPKYEGTDLPLEDIPAVIQKLLQESAKLKIESAEMKQFVDLKHEEIIALEKSAKEAVEKMNADSNLLAEKSQEIQQLEDKLKEADNQLQSYCKDFSVKNNDISKWKEKCEATSKSIEELQKQLATLESTNTNLNSTIDEVEENLQLVYSEKQQLKATLINILVECDSNYEGSFATFEDIPIAIQNLCNEFMQKRNEVNQMGIILESKNGEILSLEKNIENLKGDVNKNAVILDKKTEEMQQLQIKLEESESELEKYLADIKNKDAGISDWEAKNEVLSKNIDDLKTKLESSQSENVMLNSTIDEVEENLQKIYLEKQQLKDAFDNVLVEYILNYKDTCSSLEDIPIAIKQLCNERKNEVVQGKLTLDARNEEILVFENSTKDIMGKLNDKTALLEEKIQAIEQLQIKVMALEDQIQNYCKDIKAKEDELTNSKMNCDTYKTSLSELQKQINSLASANEILTTTVKEVEEKLQNAYHEKQQLSSRLDSVIAEYASTSEVAQHEESTLKLEFAKNKEFVCTVRGTISPSNASIHEIKEKVDVLIQFIQQYKQNVEKLKQENEEKAQLIVKQEFVAEESEALLENLKLSKKNLQNLNFEITQRCKESDKEVCSVQEERKQLLKQLENLNESEINLQKLNEANAVLQQDIVNWKAKFDDLVSYNESIQTSEAQKSAPSDPETEIKDQQLSQQTSDLSDQLHTLEKEKGAVESELFVLRSASDKAKETEEGLKAKIEQLEHERASIQRKLSEQLLLVQKKTQAVENMSMSISDIKLENDELQSRKNSLQEKLKKLETELIQCKSDYRTVHDNLEMLKLEHAPLVSEKESLRAIISDLKAREKDLIVKAEINAEIFSWKSCNSDRLNDEDNKSSDSADKGNSAAIKDKKLMASSAPLIKEFFENATKILNFIIIWKGDASQRTDIKSGEISGSKSVEQDQLQISTALELLSTLNEKLSAAVAKLQTPDADAEICIESNNDVLLLLAEFKNCLSALCTCLHTYKTTSEKVNRKLEQEVQMLRAESTSHSGNSAKIAELDKQVQDLTAQKKTLDSTMLLMKNNSYRLEKHYLTLQKQHSELQEKMQKLGSSSVPRDNASHKILEEKVMSLTEELQAVNEKLEKSETELLDVFESRAEVEKKHYTSRQECLSLRAHLKYFQNKLREQSQSGDASKVKATPLKESAQGAPATNQESTSKLCPTTGKENRT